VGPLAGAAAGGVWAAVCRVWWLALSSAAEPPAEQVLDTFMFVLFVLFVYSAFTEAGAFCLAPLLSVNIKRTKA
jgi:hypothetical protein